MAVDASIITTVKDNVILVPSAAVQTSTSTGQSTVCIMKNGAVSTVNVTVGASNDTQTEIDSGVSENDTVVTGTTTTAGTTSTGTTSIFSTLGGRGGGAAIRGAATGGR
jgi:multidrug efflux pump subunit AcrA (membrane-fusion protein)